MDPGLTLASATAHHHHHGHNDDHDPSFLDPALAQEDIDAATAEIINASIRTAAQAHAAAAAEAEAEAAEAVVAEAVAEATSGSGDQLEYQPEGDESTAGPSTRVTTRSGNVVVQSTPSLYPYVPPQRDDSTPCPVEQTFTSRAEFDVWMAAEDSWCHYVQRRVTNPEKRADERAKARDKAHELRLAEMDPEEAAREPPLKKRHRTRTSQVVHKITYTCHHAGKYQPQHKAELPQERLRMNTKVSVKCGCLSRVVMNEMENGEIKIAFWWKHNGHDPFTEKEAETYRLPQSVTDWLIAQFQKGKEPEDIIKMLNIPVEEKLERIRRTNALSNPSTHPNITGNTDSSSAYLLNPDPIHIDALSDAVHGGVTGAGVGVVGDESQNPTAVDDEDLPPIIAYGLQIKYPDLYNRYRKVGPPLRSRKSESGLVDRGRVGQSGDKPAAKVGAGKRGRKRKGQNGEGGDAEDGIEKIGSGSGVSGSKRQKGKGKEVEADMDMDVGTGVGVSGTIEEIGDDVELGQVGNGQGVGLGDGSTMGQGHEVDIHNHQRESSSTSNHNQQQAQIYMVNDDFTFDDLVNGHDDPHSHHPHDETDNDNDNLHHHLNDALPSDSITTAEANSTSISTPTLPHVHNPADTALHAEPVGDMGGEEVTVPTPTFGVREGSHEVGELGAGVGVDEGRAGMMDDEEEESARMTEELEKLANEITSTWRH